jgi:glycosyltransferase involved in cell wall biosynthesis
MTLIKAGYICDLCIPAKDEGKTIGATLEKLSKQTVYQQGLMRIIIANYNPYNEVTETEQAASFYEHAVVVPVLKTGIGHARNLAVRAGDANFIVSFDADSYYSRMDAVERLIEPLVKDYPKDDNDRTKTRLTHCDIKFTGKSTKTTSVHSMVLDMFSGLYRVLPVTMGSCMAFERSAYERIGGFKEIEGLPGEDWDFTARMCLNFSVATKKYVKGVTVYSSDRRHSNFKNEGLDIFNYDKHYNEQ